MKALLARRNFDGLDWEGMTGFYRFSAEVVRYLLFDPKTRETNAAALNTHLADRSTSLTELLDTSPRRLGRHVKWYTRSNQKAYATIELTQISDTEITRRSLSATGGTLLGPEFHFDLVRPGIGLYGGLPFEDATPVVSVSIPVIQTREVRPFETVGYGNAWEADIERRIATIAAG